MNQETQGFKITFKNKIFINKLLLVHPLNRHTYSIVNATNPGIRAASTVIDQTLVDVRTQKSISLVTYENRPSQTIRSDKIHIL